MATMSVHAYDRFFYAVALPCTLVGVLLALHIMPARGTSLAVKARSLAVCHKLFHSLHRLVRLCLTMVQVNVGLAWICALSTLILVPSDIYHAMQVGCVDKLACAAMC